MTLPELIELKQKNRSLQASALWRSNDSNTTRN